MTNALVQNISKARGFDPQEQLILQIALGGILGGNNGGGMNYGSTYGPRGGYGSRAKQDPWMSMIMTLAGLLLAQKAMQKASVAQSLNPQNGTPTVGQSALSLAKMLLTGPSPTQSQAPLQQAHNSLTNPTAQNLQSSNNTLATFKPLAIQPKIPHPTPTLP